MCPRVHDPAFDLPRRVGPERNCVMLTDVAARPTHPGTVTFVGPNGRYQVESADRLPEAVAFAPGPDGSAVPVVRVVHPPAGAGYGSRSYAADGRLLRVSRIAPASRPAEPARPVVRERALAAEPTGWF